MSPSDASALIVLGIGFVFGLIAGMVVLDNDGDDDPGSERRRDIFKRGMK